MIDEKDLRSRLDRVMHRMDLAASKSGRKLEDVTLVAVSKGKTIEVVEVGYAAGLREFGENYAEEGTAKMKEFPGMDDIRWHMIGHIQSRKARLVAQYYDVVHSLDSLKLAKRLNRFASELGKKIPVLLEINISGEGTKYGWVADQREMWPSLVEDIHQIAQCRNLVINGIMAMVPYSIRAEDSRPFYREMGHLRDFLESQAPQIGWTELSMGMSSDFDIAIEEGATMVRIGEAIFGPRKGYSRIEN